MYGFAALAMMTKGLIGIVIPAIVIGAWIALTNNWKILKSVRIFTGLLLFLAIAAPWHILMAMKHPEFLDFYFVHEHFTRFLTDEHKRTAPWWFFIAVTGAGAMPWLVVSGKWLVIRKNDDGKFLLIWIILPLIFFSASHSKLVPYIFPIFPPLFVLIGKDLADIWQQRKKLIIGVFCFMVVFEISANYIAPQFDNRTIKPLAEFLQPQLKNDDLVVAYNSYWQDLPVYLDRNIIVVDWQGELGFGVEYTRNAREWMITSEEFWAKCASAKTNVFIFIRDIDLQNLPTHPDCKLQEINRYGRTILLKKIY